MSQETRYVDARRTHEVQASVEKRGATEFVVRERAFGSRELAETFVERRLVGEAWELKMHQLRLEARLATLGAYYREVAGGWAPVRPAQAGEPVDLAPLDVGHPGGAVAFHHFGGPDGRAATLVGVRHDAGRGFRTLLARVDYAFPDAEKGNVQVVHERLPDAVYRSALLSVHLDLRERGFAKVPANADVILGRHEWGDLRAALDDVVALLAATTGTKSAVLDGIGGKGADVANVVAFAEAARRARGAASAQRTYDLDFELDPASAAVKGKPQEVMIDDLSPDVVAAMRDPRLLALHARFLRPGEEEALLAKGERAIRLAAVEVRARVRPHEQHLVSILEASLLLRHAFAKRVRVDPEVLARVRHAAAYL